MGFELCVVTFSFLVYLIFPVSLFLLSCFVMLALSHFLLLFFKCLLFCFMPQPASPDFGCAILISLPCFGLIYLLWPLPASDLWDSMELKLWKLPFPHKYHRIDPAPPAVSALWMFLAHMIVPLSHNGTSRPVQPQFHHNDFVGWGQDSILLYPTLVIGRSL